MACEAAYSFLHLFAGDGGGQPQHPAPPWGQGWVEAETGVWPAGGGQDQAQRREPGSHTAWGQLGWGGPWPWPPHSMAGSQGWGHPWLRWCWVSPEPPKSNPQEGFSPYYENNIQTSCPDTLLYSASNTTF